MSQWEVIVTEDAEGWLLGLNDADFGRIAPSIDELERRGPALGRPYVDTIDGSRHSNMKELRSFGGHLRMLFAFDPKRRAIILLGGDKTDDWRGWYQRNIPVADRLFDDHLETIKAERR